MKITSLSKVVMDDFTAHTINIQYKCPKTNQVSQTNKVLEENVWSDILTAIEEFVVEDKTTQFSAGKGSIRQITLNQFGYVRDHELS